MADKPSRALVLCGEGLARFISPAQTHLHSFASRASCGFLALPNSPPSENEDSRIIREFVEILDSNEAYSNEAYNNLDVKKDKPQETCAFPSVAERFMGMKAAIITDNVSLKSFGSMLGFKVFFWNEMSKHEDPLASELVKLLGFQNGKILDTSDFDLVFVHVGANTTINGFKDIELVNHLVGDLLYMCQSESDVGSRLHSSVILSYGPTVGDNDLEFSVSNNNHNNDNELSHLIPRQSYMTKGGKLRENIRPYCPMLLAQYQNAVTRVDMVKTFSFRDFIENGGNLVIPADRFLHEVAFKLWMAPKYGA